MKPSEVRSAISWNLRTMRASAYCELVPPPPRFTTIKMAYGEGFFVIDDACVTPDFPRKHTDVLEINRSCSRIVVRNLGALLRNVRWVGERRCAADSSRERGVFSRWLPLALSLDDLMSMLPHLLVPGTVLSVRASCVLALLCVQPETGTATLREPAAAHLRRKRGSAWLDFSARKGKHSAIILY